MVDIHKCAYTHTCIREREQDREQKERFSNHNDTLSQKALRPKTVDTTRKQNIIDYDQDNCFQTNKQTNLKNKYIIVY